jgi:DNA polymerase (family X)
MADLQNTEIAAALDELGTLYELDGAVRYRVIAYREAARVVRDSPLSVAELAREGRATQLPGIGKTLEGKIVTLLETGSIPSAEKLKKRFPASLVEVTNVPGLGAKTARRLHDELGISTLEQLKEAAESGRLRDVKGMGPKAEENILASVGKMEEEGYGQRRLLSKVLPVAEDLARALREVDGAHAVEVAGSARRWAETCKDIDLIATGDDPDGLAKALAAHPLAAVSGSAGDAGARIVTHHGIKVDLRVARPEVFGNLLQHFSGSAEHNVQLRERAVGRGLSVSEHGIKDTETGDVTLCETEAEVYAKLGLPYIEPELREGTGEIAAAEKGELPELVSVDDIRGDLHCHTTLSDGRNTLEEMAEGARARGYAYLAVTDHSASHGFGNHVTPQQLEERIEEVRELDPKLPRFKLLAGSEVNINTDGSLDYSDELLDELDWVMASVHTSFRMGEREMTDRIVTAIENPLVDCIGHLTGRLILRRRGYRVNVERIIEAAAEHGTMLEINGNPNRRDLSDQYARLASEAGVTIAINTDAHGVDTMANIAYGVATARRAWLGPKQVANARSWRDFKKLLKPKRG